MRCTPMRMHAYKLHAYKVHAYEMHAYKMHAYEMLIGAYPRDVHPNRRQQGQRQIFNDETRQPQVLCVLGHT
jgi:hypothetical protein